MMKNLTNYLLLAVALAFCGCDKNGTKDNDAADRDPVRFVTASVPGSATTRASYSGDVIDGKERIDWNTGDHFRVSCNPGDGTAVSYADYAVTGGVTSEGYLSYASAALYSGTELFWRNCRHNFASLCPAPATEAPEGGTLADLGYAVNGTSVTAAIPAQQPVSWKETVAMPDMRYAPLMASVTEAAPPETVKLAFRPAFNAFEFTFNYEKTSPIQILGFELSSETKALSGTYTVSFNGNTDGAPIPRVGTITVPQPVLTGTDANNKVYVPLNVSLGENDSFTITVFTLPGEHTGMKATLYTDSGNKTLAIKDDNGEYFNFPSCGKARMTGLVIPNSPRISFIAILLEPWDNDNDIFVLRPDSPRWNFMTVSMLPWIIEGEDLMLGLGSSE